jgi:cytochrome c oxidase assembly protein subunit 15
MNRTSHNPRLHRYAILVAVSTLLLIIAGALVTGNDAGLSVPDWPTSFGSFRMPRMVGGVKFEHGHRMVAATVGILTMFLALWLWLKDSRRWVRRLGGIAVLAVVAQAVLGGITVLFYLPRAVSVTHAALAQIFFCLTFSLALFTRSAWRWDEPKVEDFAPPSLRHLALATTGACFVQLILGAAYRHSGLAIAPHIVGAMVVTLLTTWMVTRVLTRFSGEHRLVRAALVLLGLLVVQVFLGVGAYVMKMAARNAPQPLPPVVAVTTMHVAAGALTLVACLYLTYQAYRFVAPLADGVKVGEGSALPREPEGLPYQTKPEVKRLSRKVSSVPARATT